MSAVPMSAVPLVGTTPFHPRLAELNQAGLWSHWAGYLSAVTYGLSAKHEYFAVRSGVGIFDTSPLYKYAIRGPDAQRFLAGVLARDIRALHVGTGQYTVWCDDRGFVLEDGVVFRHGEQEFLLTTAEPNHGYLGDLIGSLDVTIEDVSGAIAALAVQGPRSRAVLVSLAPEVERLRPFELCDARIGGVPVRVSRTGFTGDLGYEVWVDADGALVALDAVLGAGQGHGMRPVGQEALSMARIEAGLLLLDVDFRSSRLAFTDHDRVTPFEVGLGWMVRDVEEQDRPFVGRRAIVEAHRTASARWSTVGLQLDWHEHDRVYSQAGLVPPRDATPVLGETMLYDEAGEPAGFATSRMYSPMLQRHIAIARVRPGLAAPGSRVQVEHTINHEHRTIAARVAPLPLFRPERKTA